VTKESLQRRYPCSHSEWAVSDVELYQGAPFVTHYSSIDLNGSDLVVRPRVFDRTAPLRIVTIGSLAQRYKGVDVLIKAVSALTRLGHRCELTVVGDGRYRGELEALATSLDLPVRFTSHLKRPQVMSELDRADLFVLASRTEGLPRVVIEAMARGLPCIGTRVGGIPELLDSRALCEPGSVSSLLDRLLTLVTGSVDANELAAANLRRAEEFRADILRERRREFYRKVRLMTEEWRQAKAAA
jgi:glycosyltransferase involved in cell wall biosynthesis